MADINIQRKKSSPSPWLLVVLVVLVLGAAAYFLLRHDAPAPTAEPAPTPAATPVDSLTGAETGPRPDSNTAVADLSATEESAATPASLAALAASEPTSPDYGRQGLLELTAILTSLADRDDLRQPEVTSRRDDLTSATSRLQEADGSLRAGYVAAATLIQAMQQQGYPALEAEVANLTDQAQALSGRADTPQERQAIRSYLLRASRLVQTLSQPPVR